MSEGSARRFDWPSLTQRPPTLDIDFSLGKGKSLVQTEFGAARNEWISYMCECSCVYRARKEAERVGIVNEGPVDPPVVPDKVKRAQVGEPRWAKRVRKE